MEPMEKFLQAGVRLRVGRSALGAGNIWFQHLEFNISTEPRRPCRQRELQLCLFISLALASRGWRGEHSRAGEGKHVEPESGGEREGQENKNTAAKKKSLKRAIHGLPGAVLAQGRARSTCCWSRQLGACTFHFTPLRCPLVQLHAQHSVLGCS